MMSNINVDIHTYSHTLAQNMLYNSIFKPDAYAGALVLVTGGGTGIGRAVAAELVICGASVTIAGRRLEELERTRGELGARCHVQ